MMNETKKYYEVKAKCGHVGRTKCVMIHFAVVADDAKQAAAIVREMGRVKHDHGDAIQWVKGIPFETYMQLRAKNDADPYLHCKSKWEQSLIEDLDERIEDDEFNLAKLEKRTDKQESREFRYKRQQERERYLKKEVMAYGA